MADETDRTSGIGTTVSVGLLAIVLFLAFAQSCGSPQPDDPSDDAPTAAQPERPAPRSDETEFALPPASDTHQAIVTAARFDEWPFTVDVGTLRCRDGVSVTFEAGGTEYGVNGTAQDAGYPSVKPIWADDKELDYGLKVDISEVLDYGRGLC
ncbi:hypothetical protein [Streptomyces kronopolitis]|uniref:hypothetical protein n=1 Tax=Streptomyces kronopolitis TaxID=1612435 RepID=UPI003425DD81